MGKFGRRSFGRKKSFRTKFGKKRKTKRRHSARKEVNFLKRLSKITKVKLGPLTKKGVRSFLSRALKKANKNDKTARLVLIAGRKHLRMPGLSYAVIKKELKYHFSNGVN